MLYRSVRMWMACLHDGSRVHKQQGRCKLRNAIDTVQLLATLDADTSEWVLSSSSSSSHDASAAATVPAAMALTEEEKEMLALVAAAAVVASAEGACVDRKDRSEPSSVLQSLHLSGLLYLLSLRCESGIQGRRQRFFVHR